MENDGQLFLNKVFDIVQEETASHVPLIQFKHPKELQVNILAYYYNFFNIFFH